jgi:general stress protein YciG
MDKLVMKDRANLSTKDEITPKEKKPRGFAAMDPERQREIASKGGKIAHLRGNAHEFTPDEAREAGRKGGQSISKDREHMAKIGKLGGEARGHGKDRAHQRKLLREGGEGIAGEGRLPPS